MLQIWMDNVEPYLVIGKKWERTPPREKWAGLYGQQHRNNRPGKKESCEEIRADFPVAIFLESNVFLKVSKGPGTWWYGKALCCDVSSREVVLWGPRLFGGLRMEAIWSYLLGTAAMARRCQHLNQTPTINTPNFRIPSAQVHHPKFQSPILRPGETYKHHSWHVFKAEDLVFWSGHVVH